MDPKAKAGLPLLLRKWDVLAMLPFSASTLSRLVRQGRFPQPLQLSSRIVAWRTEEVLAWIESCGRGAS